MRLYGETADERSILLELARLRSEGVSYSKCAKHLNGRRMFNSNGDDWTESSVTMTCRTHLDAERVVHNITTADARIRLGIALLEMVGQGEGEKAELARMALDVYGQSIAVGMEPASAGQTAKDITKMEYDKRREERKQEAK